MKSFGIGKIKLELSTGRLKSLTDGVYAIAMTLLVLNLGISEPTGGHSTGSLLAELKSLWPKWLHYVQSFFILAALWMEHHQQFHFIKRSDRRLFWINILGLLFVTFLPFSTELVGEHGMLLPAVLIFELNMFAIGVIYYWHWVYATKDHRLVDQSLDSETIVFYKWGILAMPVVTLIAISLAFVSPRWSTIALLLIPLFMLVYKRY